MRWTNYHQHCNFCDGSNPPEDYIKQAVEQGIRYFGYSSHAPLNFPVAWCIKPDNYQNYINTINALKVKYADTLPIFVGNEIDYIPGIISPTDALFSTLDYTIGSVHFGAQLPSNNEADPSYWEIDGTKKHFNVGLQQAYGGNIKKAVSHYFQLTRNMLLQHTPDILGHMDKIKMHNTDEAYFSESDQWYKAEVFKTLETAAQTNVIIEVNTRGVYKKKTITPYPSPFVLRRIKELNIPIMLNSDAHHPKEITAQFNQTAELLLAIGFSELSILTPNGWQSRPFNKNGIIL